MLKVRDLTTSYGKIDALKGISLDAREGEITCLLGPNGAGKTTAMLSVAGILKPKRGTIRLAGRDLNGRRPHEIVMAGMALVPENRLVFPEMTVRDNLEAGAYLRGDRDGIARDLDQVFSLFPRLKERISQAAGTLSGGEQQMLAVGRALMSRPKLLLMDEPSLGLAPLIVQEIFAIVATLNKEGTTILLVEQNAHLALKIAHRFYLLEQGRITFTGSPGELAEEDVIARAYLGTKH